MRHFVAVVVAGVTLFTFLLKGEVVHRTCGFCMSAISNSSRNST